MKTTNIKTLLIAFGLFSNLISAQTEKKEQRSQHLPELDMVEGVNIHFISPEPIQFVDLSTQNLTGDLPIENIARVKAINSAEQDSILNKSNSLPFKDGEKLGVVTIVGQSFMAQYQAVFRDKNIYSAQTNIQIQPEHMQPLEFPKMNFSNLELRNFALDIIKKDNDNPLRKIKELKLEMALNNVYVIGDYIFLDIMFKNKSNLTYDTEAIKYIIDDKKIHKATNSQSIEIKPIYQLYKTKSFKKNFRNVYVFKKITFPNSKIMKIRMLEEQLSGRVIEMKVKYSDILNADTF